jgi:hypothetical protein
MLVLPVCGRFKKLAGEQELLQDHRRKVQRDGSKAIGSLLFILFARISGTLNPICKTASRLTGIDT